MKKRLGLNIASEARDNVSISYELKESVETDFFHIKRCEECGETGESNQQT